MLSPLEAVVGVVKEIAPNSTVTIITGGSHGSPGLIRGKASRRRRMLSTLEAVVGVVKEIAPHSTVTIITGWSHG